MPYVSLETILDPNPSIASLTTSIQEAIILMRQAEEDCLLIVETLTPTHRKLVGLLSEREIVQLLGNDSTLAKYPVQKIMSTEFMTLPVSEQYDLGAVLDLYDRPSVNHLAVVDDQGYLVGLIIKSRLMMWASHILKQQEQRIADLEQSDACKERAEAALKRQLRHSLLLQQITQALHAQLSLSEVLETATTLVGQVMEGNCCLIRTHEPKGSRQTPLLAKYAEPKYLPTIQSAVSIDTSPCILQRLLRHQIVASSNVYADPLFDDIQSLCHQTQLKSVLAVPISFRGQLSGFLSVHQYDHFRQWTTSELKLIQAIAMQVGIAIAQTQLVEQERTQWEVLNQQNRLLQQEVYERKQLELALQASKAQLNDVMNNVIAAIASVRFFADYTWKVDYRSAGYEQVFGYTPEEMAADLSLWISRIPPEDFEIYMTQLAEDIRAERQGVFEYRFQHKNGHWCWISETYSIRRDEIENCWIVTTVDVDVTRRKQVEDERRQTESALQRSEEYNRAILQAIPDLITMVDSDGLYLSFSHKNFAGDLIKSDQDPIGKNLIDLLPPEIAENKLKAVQQALVTNEIQIYEQQVQLEDRIQYEEVRVVPCWKEAVVCIIRDISERKRDEAKRKQVEQALRLIFEGTASKTGSEFFQSLVRHLAEVLQVRYAFVTQLIGAEKTKAKTLAFWEGDSFGKNFEYDLAGTPCEGILTNEVIYYSSLIQERFPSHKHLAKLGAESYFGVPLNDSAGKVIGHLKVLDTRPLVWEPTSEQILHIFAARAGAELERIEIALRQAETLAEAQRQSIELEKAKNAAEAANVAKSEFLANMSHELRTPLNAILGFTQVMSYDTLLKPEHQEFINIINRSGQYLLELINDVLEMSKIEAGRTSLNSTRFDFYHLLDSLQEMFQLKANAKRIALTVDRPSDLPQYITADESKLRQILLNLLGNAIKFTTKGCVVLRVRAEQREWGMENKKMIQRYESSKVSQLPLHNLKAQDSLPLTLYFEVEDTGPGIAAEEMQYLFKPFVQTQAGKKSSEGTGLGLALTYQYIQLMSGEITVNSILGKGSLFRFHIPVYLAQAANIPDLRHQHQVKGLAPNQPCYRLLIVEDQWENSQVLVKLLQPLGFEIQVAKTGEEGIERWESWQPHLIWMDMRMPVMSGYEATRQIKATPKGQATVIIAVTGSAFEEDRAEILKVGCDDFISKPFRAEVIFTKLAEHLNVQYIYAERSVDANPPVELHSVMSNSVLQPYTLEVMSKEWIARLRQAAIEGRDRQVLELIQQIPEVYSDLAQTLREQVYQFNFQEIIALTQSVEA